MATKTKNEILDQARLFLRDRFDLDSKQWGRVLEQARLTYSRDRPLELIADISGTGSYDYTLTGSVASWVNRASFIRLVEYPAGQQEPEYIDEGDEWTVYRSDSNTEKLRFLEASPAASETIRITYTTPHTLGEASTTIEAEELEAFALLVAYYATVAKAAEYLRRNRSNVATDSTDWSAKYDDLLKHAETLKKQYGALLTGGTADVHSYALATKNFDRRLSTGYPFLTRDEDEY